jgi:hypothetical protein
MCRDAGILDSRITLTTIASSYKKVMGSDMTGAGGTMSFFQWQTLMVQLANLKYKELRAMVAMRVMLRKWLVPMVYVHVPRTVLSDFVFTSHVVTLCLTYETHLRHTFPKP